MANGYHQLLMKRRVSESRLDDIEGINKSRKQALLRVFGSVERLRGADADEIAAVQGIGARLAVQIKEGLATESAKRLRGSRVSP